MDKALKQAKPQLQVSAVYFPRGNLTKIQKHIPVFSRLGACRIQSNGEEHEELRVSGFFGGPNVLRRSICAAERDEAVAQLAH